MVSFEHDNLTFSNAQEEQYNKCENHVTETRNGVSIELKDESDLEGNTNLGQDIPPDITPDVSDSAPDISDFAPVIASNRASDITYGVEDVPPWHYCALLGMQQYLTMIGSTITYPFIIAPLLCIEENDPMRAKMISCILFVSGIVTLMQTTFGVRLPIVQGGSFAFLLPTIVILTTSFPSCETYDFSNITTAEKDEIWMVRMREIQGAIILSSLFQVLIGVTGLVGFLLSWITPLSIVPTITLLGLALFETAAKKSSGNWYISTMTAFFLILFSQYFVEFGLPFPSRKNGKWRWAKVQLFKLFPVILAILIAWIICAVLTATDVFSPESATRTDRRLSVITRSPWFYLPYPLQFGVPTFTLSSVIGMLAGVLSSVVESIGDYYACAKLAGVASPPKHSVNRGISVEGLGCIVAGLLGTGTGMTSYSQNIAAIRVTKVASRRVVQVGACIMIIFGLFGKFGAVFATLPNPVIGGVFLVMFSIITAVGLSNLQVVDLNSSRNIFVLGFSLFMGLTIPEWMRHNRDSLDTGSPLVDQILTVLLSTHMFVGGAMGILLDNTVPGTAVERGLHLWNKNITDDGQGKAPESSCYDLPFGMRFFRRSHWCSKVPVSPTFLSMRNAKK